MMQEVLTGILTVVAAVLCGIGCWAAYEAVGTLRSVRRFADDVRNTLVPVLQKADVTLDAVNEELGRIDAIVTQVEEVSDRVSSTAGVVSHVVNAPMEAVGEIGSRLRRVFSHARFIRRDS